MTSQLPLPNHNLIYQDGLLHIQEEVRHEQLQHTDDVLLASNVFIWSQPCCSLYIALMNHTVWCQFTAAGSFVPKILKSLQYAKGFVFTCLQQPLLSLQWSFVLQTKQHSTAVKAAAAPAIHKPTNHHTTCAPTPVHPTPHSHR